MRDIATDLLTAIESGQYRPIAFYEGQFRNTGTLAVEYMRLWTGYGDLSWDSHTWSGTGIMSMEGIEETTDSRSVGFRVQLNGIQLDKLSIIFDADKSRYLPGTIWLGAMAADGSVIADPYLMREGFLDTAGFSDSAGSLILYAAYEDQNAALLKAYDLRYTTQSQALFYPGDPGFDQVPTLQDIQIAT